MPLSESRWPLSYLKDEREIERGRSWCYANSNPDSTKPPAHCNPLFFIGVSKSAGRLSKGQPPGPIFNSGTPCLTATTGVVMEFSMQSAFPTKSILRTEGGGVMAHFRTVVMALTMSFLTTFAIAGEEGVLKSLEKVRNHIQGGVTRQEYDNLVAKAKAEIQLYKRGAKVNPTFLKHAKECYRHYEYALIPVVYEKDHVLFDLWGTAEDELELAHESIQKRKGGDEAGSVTAKQSD